MLVRTVYLSLDPAQRISMGETVQYAQPVQLGTVMRGTTLCVVEESRHSGFRKGDIVIGAGGWQEFSILADGRKIETPKAPLTAYMSVLGITGATAYFGVLDVARPKAGETVVVSAAAGAVGSIAGQIAKILGCRVVGLAGSDAKCRYVVDNLGFDACINYRNEDVTAALKHKCPDGIDVDFENVGGEILDAVLANINLKARIALCGLIATYNAQESAYVSKNFANLLMKRVRLEGFIIGDFAGRFSEAFDALEAWLKSGRMKYSVQLVEGIANAPSALQLLFSGGNTGKLLMKISAEPTYGA